MGVATGTVLQNRQFEQQMTNGRGDVGLARLQLVRTDFLFFSERITIPITVAMLLHTQDARLRSF
jgi:hypothetical protein